uniref:Ribosomal protein S25e (RP-S25e, RPS25) n=1 Tax=uncultured marine thaumarchaeote KM3_90_E04 TaxID=1456343 RepID=A0A075I3P7_9ARCH|nr:ribosomal protein S25e (RP-S25e, RPS25) [uncultured marine thaumarchaeote KM3_90_E04]
MNKMGGSKNKSPAQKDKSQKKDVELKKSKKSEKSNVAKTGISVVIDESKAIKYINAAKVITVQDLARQTDVKISAANSFLQKLLGEGTVERIGGFSGHHLYKSVSGK